MQRQALKSIDAKEAVSENSRLLPETRTFCPSCSQALSEKLVDNFYHCEECQLAVRREEDMLEPLGHYDDRWAQGAYDRETITRARFARKQIHQLGQVESILDVGCGVGIAVDVLSQHYPRVDGIDTSPDSIAHARQRARGNFELSSLADLDPKRRYDVILSTQLIEHLRQPELFLAEVASHLRPGGYIILETPNLNSRDPRSIWRSRIGGMYYGKDHRVIYTLKSLRQLLQKNGFETVTAQTVTYPPTIVEEVMVPLKKLYVRDQNGSHIAQTGQSIQKQRTDHPRRSAAGYSPVSKFFARVLYRSIFRAMDNPLGDLLLVVPNRLSQLNDRGHQAFIIGRLLAS